MTSFLKNVRGRKEYREILASVIRICFPSKENFSDPLAKCGDDGYIGRCKPSTVLHLSQGTLKLRNSSLGKRH